MVNQINFYPSWLCVDMASIMVSWHTCYSLFKVLPTESLLRGWYLKAIFSCLSLKPDLGFLPYNMLELFGKTGHGLTDIVIA